jgi:hypothetical protein
MVGLSKVVRRLPGGDTTTASPDVPRSQFASVRRRDFLSKAESAFYHTLRRLTVEHTVFAKVRVADLLCVTTSIYRSAHLDFLVLDKNLAPILAIELDGLPCGLADRRPAEKSIERVLAAAAIPLIHVPAQSNYALDEIHRLLVPYLRIGTPVF